jgi:PRC-barrel domain
VIGERPWLAHPELDKALSWIGSRVDDVYGMTIGKIVDVWTDPATERPRWLLLQGGRFGGHYTLVPFDDASGGQGDVWIPYDIATVRQAPTVVPNQPLEPELDARFVAHYAAAREAATPAPAPLPARERAEHAHRLG